MTGDDRSRGILSEADRAYLRDEADLGSVQAERNARARIRERVFNAVLDFELLVEQLSATDRELVFGKRLDATDGTEAFDGLVSGLAFLYQGVGDTEVEFETVLTEAVNVAEARADRAATVSLDLTFHRLDAAQVRARLENGEPLSLTEIAFLQRSDEVRADELAHHLRDTERAADVDDGRIQSKVTNF